MTPRIVLVGPPGAGKTTVGRLVAAELGVAFRDTDLDVEEAAGTAVADIFVEHGEAHFRSLEQAAVERALAEHDGVLAVGGGAVLDERTRAALAGQRVVFLDVGLPDAVARVGLARDRPVLLGNPRGQLKRLLDARRPLYEAVATLTVLTSGRSAEAVADGVVELARNGLEPRWAGTFNRIKVSGAEVYDVMVGDGLVHNVHRLVDSGVQRVAILHAGPVRSVAHDIRVDLEAESLDVHLVELPDGESAKRVEVAATCWSALGQAGFTRSDAVIGVGGGSVTDLAGFVAATWLRGVRVVHVPTTLLAMVDAAIGGKTGLNTPEGKNLVGAFHDPAAVVCDLRLLAGLPAEGLRSGLAEVVKCGFIADPTILDLVENDLTGALNPTSSTLRELVERSIQVKADVVAADPKESSGTGIGREALNYGHTLAHAIERVEGYRWRHGDAVAVGLRFAAELGRLAGRLDDRTADRHRAVLELLGLPTTYRADAWAGLMPAMRVDKKARGDRLRFVVLDGLARPAILDDPAPELLDAAYATLTRTGRP